MCVSTLPLSQQPTPIEARESQKKSQEIKIYSFNFIQKKKQKAYNIQDSQAVSDPSTNWTQRCLTCQIGRDGVHST
ncbi:hypothetical protein B9Z55_011024 [Caenorhabditis nigoni]|uniref:Uncharacterized protein n=1 Tax=Caenorhabditis nigoni TaxID=1611254 RepID=A0A2G5UIB2_9PELO|nr:hypothetical protein B9Z55_011024 [Caenorhabditis nigoni]